MEAPKYIELRPREEVLELAQASVLPKLWAFALAVIWSVLPFFFLFPLWRQGGWGVMAFFVWLASGLFLLGRLYFKWARTVFLVTDRRVVDHDQRGLFHTVVTQAQYEQIDEVSVHVKGVMATLLKYGTLTLKLHGAAADIEVEHIRRPEHLADLLNDLRSQTHEFPYAHT